MEIALAVLAGLYAATAVGYYKMMFRSKELAGPAPLVLKGTVGFLAIFWPVVLTWALLVEANR